MGKRFGRYKFALKAITAVGATTPPNVPAGTPLDEFQKWNNNVKLVTYGARAAASKPGTFNVIGINPFGFPAGATSIARAYVSNRGFAEASLAGIRAKCNISAATAIILDVQSYVPAKVVATKITGTATPETSKITGLKYVKREASSWTLPYGQKGSTSVESVIRAEILDAANGAFALNFNSEEL
jgi:hypothetical protein